MKKPTLAPILATLALVAALGAYASLWSAVANASTSLAGLSRQVEAKSVEAVRLASVRDRIAALGPLADTIDGYFVPEGDVVDFINELETRGKAVGASVAIASVAAVPATGEGHPALAISVTIQGSFDEVMRALGSIEYSPHELRVTSVTVAQAPSGNGWVASANVVVGTTPGAGAPQPAPAVATTTAATSSSTPPTL